ncbi:RNA-directed DNA polymerase [Pseudomonas jessenii]|uniref:RNA-directed DNA polymerase n=1 Tax=Pseudomonas jessenii TaxID=77298 RepID=UPI0032E4272D
MGYSPEFNGWEKVTLEDLMVAYRKAKADCYFENTFPASIAFADYESNLLENLTKLLVKLKAKGFKASKESLGDFRVVPKRLGVEPNKNSNGSHIHFSDPDKAFESLHKNNNLKPEFRVVGDFPVSSHIVSALWINTVGRKFDACLDGVCYGARLKRIRNDEVIGGGIKKPFHITGVGSFTPYFQPYQKWRNDGLSAIRGELEKDRNVVAVSLDLKSYYHTIDPMAITLKGFQEEIGLSGDNKLSDDEKQFTKELAGFLSSWSDAASDFSEGLVTGSREIPGGLAIGLTATRIISNVILHRWDKLILEKVTPIHYGRYVDDMFLVLRDPGFITNAEDLMSFLQGRLGEKCLFKANAKSGGVWEIQQGKSFQRKTVIRLQAQKQKIFILNGQAGVDLLDSIEKEISELSSEHRLMPSPDQLEDSTAARVLSAAGDVGEQADTLRRADGLTIRRLGWSLQLRHVETLAQDLPPGEWKKQRDEFYQFAHNHILRPDCIFSHFTYLPRLLGFAVALDEWAQAEKIVKRSYQSLEKLQLQVGKGKNIVINGVECKAGLEVWMHVKAGLTWSFIDVSAKCYNPVRLLTQKRDSKEFRLSRIFVSSILDEMDDFSEFFSYALGHEDFYKKAPLLAAADLAKVPYKKIMNGPAAKIFLTKKNDYRLLKAFEATDLLDVDDMKEFLVASRDKRLGGVEKEIRANESYLPYLFPTRPFTPAEIAELAPESVGLASRTSLKGSHKSAVVWARYVRAMRGVWVRPTLLAVAQSKAKSKGFKQDSNVLYVGTKVKKKIVVALTNIKTEDEDFAATASDKPNLKLDRYKRISDLVNQAIKLNPRPDYLLFPELSIPHRWVDSISSRLTSAGISLVAGTEYRHLSGEEVVSDACLVLTDDRLGFSASVKIWQPKLEPAVGEDKGLTLIHGKQWYYPGVHGINKKPKKPIYNHNGFYFGVMVCSELQNSKARIKLQGEVDALMVLSWNQDLDTFSALVESAALDVHAYTILVNNRKYGDSRVRSPAKEGFLRDLARVRGGDNDFVVAVTLDVDGLRAFQSRAKRWPEKNDPYKPVPEGFKISSARKRTPPR